jgi:hypothetical protein
MAFHEAALSPVVPLASPQQFAGKWFATMSRRIPIAD